MSVTLKPLDYALDALEPTISARTMGFHHGKHYAGYVANTNKLIQGTSFENLTLEDIVRRLQEQPEQNQGLFNNAAQAWNHEFFWDSLAPNGGGTAPEPVLARLSQKFGSVEAFKKAFVEAGTKQFGSGWVWLVVQNGDLEIVTTGNAHLPSLAKSHPVVVCDVWEHAYYLDYQNDRAKFLTTFLDSLINWQFVSRRLEGSKA